MGRIDDAEIAGLQVYSIDDRSIQMTWRATEAERLVFSAGGAEVDAELHPPATYRRRGRPDKPLVHMAAGPGTAVLEPLDSDTAYEVWVESPRCGRRKVARVRTLVRPRGELETQFATLNDIHIGEQRFGPPLATILDNHPLHPQVDPYPVRCVRAALGEAREWGASRVIVKGDLTRNSAPEDFRTVGNLLESSGLEADVVLGNHDVRHGVDAAAVLSEFAIDARPLARYRDLPGIRLIFAHTPGPGDKWGSLSSEEIDRIARMASDASGPCMLVSHHAPATGRVTLHYPPGIYHGPSRQLLARLSEANPACIVVAGHTHRNRVRYGRGIPCVETGSSKDYPGQWVGYRVYEGGIVQTSRRIAAPDVIAWTESTGRALGGQWARWSPGRLSDRSFTWSWPPR